MTRSEGSLAGRCWLDGACTRVGASLAALATCLACADVYTPFADEQKNRAAAASQGVDTDSLPVLVERIYQARLDDPDKDTTRSNLCRNGARCVYSRVATASLIREYWHAPEFAVGTVLREQVRTEDGLTTTNLILDIPGRLRPDEWVIATAHYDAWFGGANDNGSGVAVVLASTAPLLHLELDRSVRLLLLDGEELGMVGSGRYVAEYGTRGALMVLNADSVAFVGSRGGLLTREPAAVEYLLQANEPAAGAAYQMAELARGMEPTIEMSPLVFPGNGVSLLGVAIGYDLGDHVHFWLANVPALFPFPAGDKPDWYHTSADTPDRVDSDRLRRIGRLWAGAIAAFATMAR